MVYIKKLVVKGFKSFVRQTELDFTEEINVILGPNGSGKSNISDALCFVLGRLSAKSMRATKAKNLIFMGSKTIGPAKEAFVELIFDNSDETFSLPEKEISIKRIIRRNGLSVYKINRETKTRQEVLSLLAQAGIDPNGFNIILQGEIQNFARMHTEERRKVIEEVSGISIYESRKSKALRELEKTEERLKEVLAVLRERTNYLNNLEKERQQALKFQKLQLDVKRLKASIINFDLNKKFKESKITLEEIEKLNRAKEKIKKEMLNSELDIEQFKEKTNSINATIQKSTGLEQEKLNQEIADIRAELAGLNVKFENIEIRLSQISKQKQDLQVKITQSELEIRELQRESPSITKKQKEIELKKKQLEELEDQRKKHYMMKAELKSLQERLLEKTSSLQSNKKESEFLLKQIENDSAQLFDKNSSEEKLNVLKLNLRESNEKIENIEKEEIDSRKTLHSSENEIQRLGEISEKISKLDICPLCKNKITEQHISSIKQESQPKINSLNQKVKESNQSLEKISNQKVSLKTRIQELNSEISKRELDLIKLNSITDKKNNLKNILDKIKTQQEEITVLSKKLKSVESIFDDNSTVEHRYESLKLELQEVSLLTEENVDSEISFKQRDLERTKVSLKQILRDEQEFEEELRLLKESIYSKEESLEDKKEKEEELSKKFRELISQRESIQSKIREKEHALISSRNELSNIEQETNNFKIIKARVDAEIENLKSEILQFGNADLIKLNRDSLVEKLNRTQNILDQIGSVNLRSLEVYDQIKKEYDAVKEKADTVEKEKQGIFKIIHEIDIKKKKTFLRTLDSLNEIFSRNFAQLSAKGHVSLELENKKEPFEGGVSISVKVGHGKYFDITSLSGGEQTLVALSLIFAIQELKPYCFYILDEIDAALDKRNSQRLASLLRKYMQKGQYLVITHNDEIITNASALYGVSMHDGISKVVSLKI